MKTKKIISKIIATGIFSALIFVLTFFIKIPYGSIFSGYFNLSDSLILFATSIFGPFVGAISGIIGCCLADLASGYSIFIPFTFIAKGLESILCFLLFKIFNKRKYIKFISYFISPFIMVIVYFIAYMIINNDLNTSLISSSFDLLQGEINAAFALYLYILTSKSHLIGKLNY